ncbi:hypothetical protein Psal006b_01426 [Piscirickettsia salmonis]|uniref:Extracellular solute-binding protein family 5 protein n=1 Tax=Piscirickettsia salmonis TaxID=1238 RepID=A0A1L6TC84_PISSA|nr:hypothetical protein [Piscirickettsia salmonis]AKP74092.1 hypothetical protein PSLF89_2406 [Piscirickettsia salmonis LF-89 = ATCC VR-1361]ALB22963.1 extracellular solute-binding protein family 5 protein [Piscirickettsia salmonis]ALY02913.1 hypothetical protein AWE47_08715 [Piscirickettsia salmonis]AMA42469.1 hypothetical protein AWJ11_08930 [Piscirickettsia salmonis]AOS34939.1 hypothetical protein AVM72_06070 [Piscirickettsia salmonis]
MSGELVDAWSISGGYLRFNLNPDAAVTSGSSGESLQLQPRVFFTKVNFNGTSPSSNFNAYEGGATDTTAAAFVLTEMSLPCDSKATSHQVEMQGFLHSDVLKQFEEIRYSASTSTVVFSFDGVNKQQSCKSFDATDGASTWFTAFSPTDPIVVQVHVDRLDYSVPERSPYVYAHFSGIHMTGYKNQYALQNTHQLNIAKDVSCGAAS